MLEKPELIRVCTDLAKLLRDWDKFELGREVPAPLNYLYVAEVLDQAAKTLNA